MDKLEIAKGSALETRLLDLRSLSLEAIGRLEPSALAGSLAELYEQIDRPRVNISSGPPGRTD